MTNSEPGARAAGPAAQATAGVRVGDVERNAAVAALGEHMAVGRLDFDEYTSRSELATSARTVGDLQPLFADLPAPHPVLPGATVPSLIKPAPRSVQPSDAAAPMPTSSALSPTADERSRAQRLVAAAAGASGIIALVLFFITSSWLWFLLVPLISSVAGGMWGDSWKRPDERARDRDRRRDRHRDR